MANLKTKKFLSFLSLISLSLLFFLFFVPASASASASFGASDALKFATQANTGGIGAEVVEIEPLAGRIAKGVFSLGGLLFFLLVFYGGYTWLMARGEEEEIKKAQNIIIAACIGLFIMVGSYAITNFVLTRMISAPSWGAVGAVAKCEKDEEKHELFCIVLNKTTCLETSVIGGSVCTLSGEACKISLKLVDGKNAVSSFCESKKKMPDCETATPNLCTWSD